MDEPLRFAMISLMKCLFSANSAEVILLEPSNRKTRFTVFFVHAGQWYIIHKWEVCSIVNAVVHPKVFITLKFHWHRGGVFEVIWHGIEYTVEVRAIVTSMGQTWAGNLENRIQLNLFYPQSLWFVRLCFLRVCLLLTVIRERTESLANERPKCLMGITDFSMGISAGTEGKMLKWWEKKGQLACFSNDS